MGISGILTATIYKNYPDKSPVERCIGDNSATINAEETRLTFKNFRIINLIFCTGLSISLIWFLVELYMHRLGLRRLKANLSS